MFTAANARAIGSVGGQAAVAARRIRPKRKSARYQVLELKEIAHRDAIAQDTPIGVRASLMRAYVDLHEIDMAMRGVGKPKPVEAKNANGAKRARESASPVNGAS